MSKEEIQKLYDLAKEREYGIQINKTIELNEFGEQYEINKCKAHEPQIP